MARVEFSRKVRAAIIARAAGRCEKCSAALKPGEGEVDHVLPCALGGEATVANGRLLCRVCHVEKSATDIQRVRKADRQRDKASRAIRPKQKLRGPTFPKPEKHREPRPSLPPRPMFKEAATHD